MGRRLGSFSIVVALWTSTACSGQAADASPVTPIAEPAPEPASTNDLDERLELMSARLEQARVNHHIPGMALAVVKDDEIIFAKGFGLAELDGKRPVTPETLFAIGSTTKAFTSTLVAMQVDAGKLDWDDPVAKHVPEFQLQPQLAKDANDANDDETAAQPTLRDMLCHRSGFTRMSLLWVSGALSSTELLTVASGAEPIADFRSKFLYNNVTYASAGEAAARTAGTTWPELLQARLLDPLGMTSTTVSAVEAEADERLAQGYRWREVSEVHEPLPMRSLTTIAASGAINSNVLDMAQWLRLQLGKGSHDGNQLVSAERLADTWTPQIDVGGGIKYGFGWMLGDWQGHRLVEHGGNIDGYAAQVAMLPDDSIGFVLLTNITATPLQRESISVVFDSLLGELPAAADPGSANALNLSPYAGRYVANFGPFEDDDFTVIAEGDTLYVDVPGQTKYELRPPDDQGHWAFAITDTIKVSFDLDGEGRGQVLHMYQGGLDFELPRQGYVFPTDVTIDEVGTLLGRYRSETPDLEINVRVDGGRLVADIEGQMPFVLRPPGDDGRWHFRAKDELALSFREDGKGKIDALILHEGGADIPLLRDTAKVRPLPTVADLLKLGKADAAARKFAKLGLIEITGKIRMPASNIEGQFRMVFDSERRQRVEADFGRYGRTLETYDGKAAWSVSTLGPPTEIQGKYLRQASLSSPFLIGDWTQGYDEARVEGRVGEGKDERIVVVLRVEGLPPVKLFVDPKTGEVRASEQQPLSEGSGPISSTTELGDYRRVLGLRLPHRVSDRNPHTGATIFEIESVKQLVDGDPVALFSKPHGI